MDPMITASSNSLPSQSARVRRAGYPFRFGKRAVALHASALLLVLASTSALAQGRVSGYVRDGGTGAPSVTINYNIRTVFGDNPGSVTTDGSGYYQTPVIVAGAAVTLSASQSGYQFSPGSRSVTANAFGNPNQDFTRSSTISGKVSYPDGTGVPGVTVSRGGATASTSSGGTYSFSGLPHGTYTLTPSRNGFRFTPTSIAVTVGPSKPNQNFTVANSAPSISGPEVESTDEDTPLIVPFTVADRESATSSLTVAADSMDPSLVNPSGIVLGGTGGNRTATITPVFNANGSTIITLTVSDGEFSASLTFDLTVNAVNDPPTAGPATALRFNSTNDWLIVAGFGGVIPSDNVTIEFWEKIATNGAQMPFALIPDETTNRFKFQTPAPDGQVTWEFGDANRGGRLAYTPAASLVGTWQHFAVVMADANSGNYIRIYRNGVLEAQKDHGTNSFVAGNYELLLGGQFSGDLAEFRIWSVPRSDSEIRRNKDVPLAGGETGLILYYRFIEGSGPAIHDFAPAAGLHPGTTFNNPSWLASGASPDLPSTVLVNEDTPTSIILPAFDADSAVLTYSITTPPTHGTIVGDLTNTGPSVVYLPGTNYNGPDSLVYSVSDGELTALASVSIKVADANDLPVISTIPNQTTEENEAIGPIPITVSDPDNAADGLTLSALSLDNSLVNSARVQFGGSGTNRTITVTPEPGESGTVTIQVTVFDGLDSTSTAFDLRVEQRPAFAVLDLPPLPGRPVTTGADISDNGSVVGVASINSLGQQGRGFLFNGLENGSVTTELGTLGGATSAAYGVNGSNVVVGASLNGAAQARAFLFDGIRFTDLGTLAGGTTSEARAINHNGVVAGFSGTTSGSDHAFIYNGTMTDLGTLPGFDSESRAFAINNSDQVVGVSYNNITGESRAFLHNGTTLINLGVLPGDQSTLAYDINRFDQIVGVSKSTNAPSQAFLYEGGSMTGLGTLPGGGNSEANGINDFGQVVGWAVSSNGQQRATFYSSGKSRDLNDLIPEDSGWTLQTASAINNRGEITGTGLFRGQRRAFLAIPANVIGKPVTRPQGAVARLPDIELLDFQTGDTELNSFFFSSADKKLYAVRPVTARLRWPLSANVLDTNRINAISVNVWPKTPQIHVANAPVEIEPKVTGFAHTFLNLLYTTSPGAAVDAGTKVFNASQPGYSVLLYLKTDGLQPDPNVHKAYFEVVRSVLWNNPAHLLDLQPWPIGTPVTSSFHTGLPGRNGHVFFENAFYDGAGSDRAYDRASRTGPIIPVNRDTPLEDDDMVIVWYGTNQIGVAWGHKPVRYTPEWPATADRIVIASTTGSGPLDPTVYPSMRLYNQPDRAQPGFNPNEEHAFLAASASGGGQSLFALRNDLNEVIRVSDPFCLLKYKDPASNEWRTKVFAVVREDAAHTFRYSGEAGKQLLPPYPLSVLNLCPDSYGVSGPYWEDFNGRLYARAAGVSGDLHEEVVARFFYPLQPDFYYLQDVPTGACIAWLDHRPGGVANQPIDVHYDVRWPETAPLLEIGESLLTPKRGLPDVLHAARIEVVYDASNPSGSNLLDSVVRLYDPLSERVLKISELTDALDDPSSFLIPSTIARQNVAGKEVFTGLPFHIRTRLRYDPLNKWFMFGGVLDSSYVGEPLLLPNVLTERERDRIKELDGGGAETDFDRVIDALYDLSRNPNQVDLNPKDGVPDKALRIGLTRDGTNVVLEQLGGPKALTAGIGSAPPPTYAPGQALSFNGTNSSVSAGSAVPLANTPFTIEFWANRGTTGSGDEFVIGQGGAGAGTGLRIGFLADDHFTFDFGQDALTTADTFADTGWHHWACTFDSESGQRTIYFDGRAVAGDIAAGGYSGAGTFWIGRGFGGNFYSGLLDDVRVWNALRGHAETRSSRSQRLLGTEPGLLRYFRFDADTANTVLDESATRVNATLIGATHLASDAPTGIAPRFVTLAENNDPSLGLPVTLKIIRVEDGPFNGDLKVIFPDNVFDEKLVLRHSSDFGGEPELLEFQWFYKPDATNFNSADLPVVNPVTGNVVDTRGWLQFTSYAPTDGTGVNYVTLGDGGETSLLTLGDNWFVMRYRGFNVGGETNWSDWIGDPASVNPIRAQLAEGWIKRVIRGINPFEQRTTDFHASAANTFASMLVQAGPRYEGDVALNSGGDNVNQIGLIEVYSTVLNRGKALGIDGSPPVSSDAANNALLLAASRIADLYTLLGNEAFADAADPLIGFSTDSGGYGSLATSIFAFQNQLDSLLEEELALLRGRDDRSSGVQGKPVYNRLVWNFTSGDGEVAYAQTYNISDANGNGFVNEADARVLYPQGHGDAWGHYLTGLTTYYDLLRHPNYDWRPRTESVLVAGTSVPVDFLDERKFAGLAAAEAKTGTEIVDLTYRLRFVEDPSGQWQGYKDTDPDRAWGVTEWARRAAQGALFNWAVANAILPAEDADPGHVGIQKIDRTTVAELGEIASQADNVQSQLDRADIGLNPLGVAKGSVPFDIDPSLVDSGQTHFEQIYDRAVKAMKNAGLVWNQANQLSEQLRRNQDTVEQFTSTVNDQERDFKNRLIEIYGYPYAGDIGPGKTYPSGYDGPDLYHYMYAHTTDIIGTVKPADQVLSGYFTPFRQGLENFGFTFDDDAPVLPDTEVDPSDVLIVEYPMTTGDYSMVAPESWGQRRAPGEIQLALSDLLQSQGRLRQALQVHDNVLHEVKDKADLLEARYNLKMETVRIRTGQGIALGSAVSVILGAEIAGKAFAKTAKTALRLGDIAAEGFPKVVGTANDVTSVGRVGVKMAALATAEAAERTAGIFEGIAKLTEKIGIPIIEKIADGKVDAAEYAFEQRQQLLEFEQMIRREAESRFELATLAEIVHQNLGRVQAAVAKGERLVQDRVAFRQRTSAQTQESRYRDMAFRIFRNDALQKYRAQFDLAARYVYLAATAYDYEANLLGTDSGSGREFLTDIVRQRSLGQMINGLPIAGTRGLADPLGRLAQNFSVLKPQLGFNNPQTETGRFSLRSELFRIRDSSDATWREELKKHLVANLWDVPEFRRFCRPFAPESFGAQPGLVIRFPTTVTFGQNFFKFALSGGDSAYDPTLFATRVRSVGVWFTNYNGSGLSLTPRVYLIPAGADVLRAPTFDTFETREWRVIDQKLPIPFPIGFSALDDPAWIPMNDSLSGIYGEIRRFSSFRAYHDRGFFTEAEATTNSRLIGRSVVNTDWMLIIPGGTFLADPNQGLETFINSVDDIKIFFQTYSYSGN